MCGAPGGKILILTDVSDSETMLVVLDTQSLSFPVSKVIKPSLDIFASDLCIIQEKYCDPLIILTSSVDHSIIALKWPSGKQVWKLHIKSGPYGIENAESSEDRQDVRVKDTRRDSCNSFGKQKTPRAEQNNTGNHFKSCDSLEKYRRLINVPDEEKFGYADPYQGPQPSPEPPEDQETQGAYVNPLAESEGATSGAVTGRASSYTRLDGATSSNNNAGAMEECYWEPSQVCTGPGSKILVTDMSDGMRAMIHIIDARGQHIGILEDLELGDIWDINCEGATLSVLHHDAIDEDETLDEPDYKITQFKLQVVPLKQED